MWQWRGKHLPLWRTLGAALFVSAFTVTGCAHDRSQAPSHPTGGLVFLRDTAGVDAWLSCLRDGGDPKVCAGKSARTIGGTVAEESRKSFGPVDESFTQLVAVSAVAELATRVGSWNLQREASQVLSYFPRNIPGTVRIFLVANGHLLGDAYVRTVRFSKGQAVLAPDGEPVILLNVLKIVGTYGDTAEEQARSALGVVKHEVFHVLFKRYQRGEPGWTALLSREHPLQSLAVGVLNEGIAHFVHRHMVKPDELLPVVKVKRAFEKLRNAVAVLGKGSPEMDAEVIRPAFQGHFWEKYGAISGMAMAASIHAEAGIAGLREAIRCGPAVLVRSYMKTRGASPLPREIAEAFSDFDLCRAGNSSPEN